MLRAKILTQSTGAAGTASTRVDAQMESYWSSGCSKQLIDSKTRFWPPEKGTLLSSAPFAPTPLLTPLTGLLPTLQFRRGVT